MSLNPPRYKNWVTFLPCSHLLIIQGFFFIFWSCTMIMRRAAVAAADISHKFPRQRECPRASAVCHKTDQRENYANYGRKLWLQNCLSVSCPFHVEHWVLFKMQKWFQFSMLSRLHPITWVHFFGTAWLSVPWKCRKDSSFLCWTDCTLSSVYMSSRSARVTRGGKGRVGKSAG